MATANKRRYVFHFDLENTLLMKDTANGINLLDNVSDIKIHHSLTNFHHSNMLMHLGLSNRLRECLG